MVDVIGCLAPAARAAFGRPRAAAISVALVLVLVGGCGGHQTWPEQINSPPRPVAVGPGWRMVASFTLGTSPMSTTWSASFHFPGGALRAVGVVRSADRHNVSLGVLVHAKPKVGKVWRSPPVDMRLRGRPVASGATVAFDWVTVRRLRAGEYRLQVGGYAAERFVVTVYASDPAKP